MSDDYFSWEDEQKLDYCKRFLGQVGPVLGGNIHVDEDDDEIELRTQIGARPARIIIDYDSGWVSVEAKLTNTVGVLVLNWDPDKKPKQSSDPWDEDKELRLFIGPGVFIEEYPDEANEMMQLVGRLPPQMIQEFVAAMPTRFPRISVDATALKVNFKPEVHEIQNPPQLFSMVFGMIDRAGRVFESGQAEVSAKPRVYIGGKPADAMMGAMPCPYCRTICDPTQGAFCPHCGAALKAPGG